MPRYQKYLLKNTSKKSAIFINKETNFYLPNLSVWNALTKLCIDVLKRKKASTYIYIYNNYFSKKLSLKKFGIYLRVYDEKLFTKLSTRGCVRYQVNLDTDLSLRAIALLFPQI